MQCFISHASEDKDSFVRELAHNLRRKGRKVWYDEFSLRPGDSLRRSIDSGLAKCNFAIVVLSQAFFAKEWPQRELDALLNAEIDGTKKLFSIWHDIDAKTVARYSPLLADKIALMSSLGPDSIAESIANLIPHEPTLSGDLLATAIELHLSRNTMVENYLLEGCKFRFFQLQSYFASCGALIESALDGVSDDQVNDTCRGLEPRFAALAQVHCIPTDVEIPPDESLPDERVSAWMRSFEDWVAGTASEDDTANFVCDLEIYFEVDYLWLLFGLPNFAVSEDQRRVVGEAINVIGSAFERDSQAELISICHTLRSMDLPMA